MSVGEQIVLRCTHGQSLSGFSQSAYRQALKELSADSLEYSPCGQQIRQAQLAALAAHRSGGDERPDDGASPSPRAKRRRSSTPSSTARARWRWAAR